MDDVYSTSENKYTFGIFNGQKLTNWIEDFKTWNGIFLKTNMREKKPNSLESKIDLLKKVIWKTSVIEYYFKTPRILIFNFFLKTDRQVIEGEDDLKTRYRCF